MKLFYFRIGLTAEQFLPYYRGELKEVVVRCEDGRRVQFPARLLLGHLSHGGVRGRFVLRCSEEFRAIDVQKA